MEDLFLQTKIYSTIEKIKYPLLVQDALSLIEENFAFLYGIDDLAEQLEVTKSHLIRTFTSHLGYSPGKYLTFIRIENAKYLLSSKNYVNLEMVAVACGFSCANYFSKVFKKYVKQTPLEYSRSISNASEYENAVFQRMYL